MKTIIKKNGQKFIITDNLYESIRKKGLMEYEQLELPLPNSENEKSSSEQSSTKQQPTKQQLILNRLIKKTKEGAIQLGLPLNKRASYANEIKIALKDLLDIYKIYANKGITDEPFCIVFSSNKFQKNIFKKWEKISSLMNAKDGRILSKKELELLSSVDLTIPPRDAMAEETKKLYNL